MVNMENCLPIQPLFEFLHLFSCHNDLTIVNAFNFKL